MKRQCNGRLSTRRRHLHLLFLPSVPQPTAKKAGDKDELHVLVLTAMTHGRGKSICMQESVRLCTSENRLNLTNCLSEGVKEGEAIFAISLGVKKYMERLLI